MGRGRNADLFRGPETACFDRGKSQGAPAKHHFELQQVEWPRIMKPFGESPGKISGAAARLRVRFEKCMCSLVYKYIHFKCRHSRTAAANHNGIVMLHTDSCAGLATD